MEGRGRINQSVSTLGQALSASPNPPRRSFSNQNNSMNTPSAINEAIQQLQGQLLQHMIIFYRLTGVQLSTLLGFYCRDIFFDFEPNFFFQVCLKESLIHCIFKIVKLANRFGRNFQEISLVSRSREIGLKYVTTLEGAQWGFQKYLFLLPIFFGRF